METPDLSLESPKIRAYFTGSDKYVPVSELLYVHTHPLLKPNFLDDIERIINTTAQIMQEKAMTGKPVERFTIMAAKLGRLLPDLNRDNAAQALDVLRDIYRLCLQITGMPGPRGR